MSNADTKYIRNKIRHLIIPVLKEINPSVESALNETAETLSGINEMVKEYILNLRDRVSAQKEDLITFNISLLNTYLHNKTLLFELFKPLGINDIPLIDLIKVIEGRTGGQLFTGTHRIIKNRDELIVSLKKNENIVFNIIKDIKELRKASGIVSVKSVNITAGFIIPSEPLTACIDAEKISFPLTLRRWNSGDYFHPLGMKDKKKLSNYFTDNKYSRFDKENSLILESGGKIAWIIGDRLDNRFRITKKTNKALIIKAKGTRHRTCDP
jgi:tRNA(Ile)-lysidine synthase